MQSYKSELFSCLYTSHLDKANRPKLALRQILKVGAGYTVLNVIVLSLGKQMCKQGVLAESFNSSQVSALSPLQNGGNTIPQGCWGEDKMRP